MAPDLAQVLRKENCQRFSVGRTAAFAVNSAAAQRLGSLIEKCESLRTVEIHLTYTSVDALRILLKHVTRARFLTCLQVIGGLSILQAKVLGNGLADFTGSRRANGDAGFCVVLEPLQLDDLLASLIFIGLERSTAITGFAIRPQNKGAGSSSVAKLRARFDSVLQRNRARYLSLVSRGQPRHAQPVPPAAATPRSGSVHTPDPIRFAFPLQFGTPTATQDLLSPRQQVPPATPTPCLQPRPPSRGQPRDVCAQINRNNNNSRFVAKCNPEHICAVAMDQHLHKIPAPPARHPSPAITQQQQQRPQGLPLPLAAGATPTVRHPSPNIPPPEDCTHELIAAFVSEADRTKQLVMDFTCREHERFLVATEELFVTVTESVSLLVAKYTALALQQQVLETPPPQQMPPSFPPSPKGGFRRPVQHNARIVHQG
jgi:hypothetical protein